MKKIKIYISIALLGIFSSYSFGQNKALELDPVFSKVQFEVGQTFFSAVTGEFKEFSGDFILNPENPVAAIISFKIKSPSVYTDNDERDEHLRTNDFLDVIAFPEITFESTRIELISEGVYKLIGQLKILAVSQEVELELLHISSKKDLHLRMSHNYEVKGEIKKSNFNMPGSMMVGNKVKIFCKIRLIEK